MCRKSWKLFCSHSAKGIGSVTDSTQDITDALESSLWEVEKENLGKEAALSSQDPEESQ